MASFNFSDCLEFSHQAHCFNAPTSENGPLSNEGFANNKILEGSSCVEDDLAIVPYQPTESAKPSMESALAIVPLNSFNPKDIQQPGSGSSSTRGTKRRRSEPKVVSCSKPFNLEMSDDGVHFCFEMDGLEAKQVANWVKHHTQINWSPFLDRLKGWIVQKDRRSNGVQVDSSFIHPSMTRAFRSVPEVIFFVKYGFVPKAPARASETKFRGKASLDNPVTFFSRTEKTLLDILDKAQDIPEMVYRELEEQLEKIKKTTSPPPSRIEGTSGNEGELNAMEPPQAQLLLRDREEEEEEAAAARGEDDIP